MRGYQHPSSPIHQILRQSALWFLTRGVLWQSPEPGIQFLSEHCLMDLPLAKGFTNWAAGVGSWVESELPHRCPKVSPDFIRKWVPEVKNLTDEQRKMYYGDQRYSVSYTGKFII